MEAALANLKRSVHASAGVEIKLRDLPDEKLYFSFLNELGPVGGLLVAVVIDMGDHNINSLKTHRDEQAAGIAVNVPRMETDPGQRVLQQSADQVARLSTPLYVQLKCQVLLIQQVVQYATLYYVQRHPESLGDFRWRIDQKDRTRTAYEMAFQGLTPMLIQTMGLDEPFRALQGANYGYFDRFMNDGPPSYLRDAYGIKTSGRPGVNIGLICREDRKFVDSKSSPGVQVADLLATGLRRCFRSRFIDNKEAAGLLGSLMPYRMNNEREPWARKSPPQVLHLHPGESQLSPHICSLLEDTMAPRARELVA